MIWEAEAANSEFGFTPSTRSANEVAGPKIDIATLLSQLDEVSDKTEGVWPCNTAGCCFSASAPTGLHVPRPGVPRHVSLAGFF